MEYKKKLGLIGVRIKSGAESDVEIGTKIDIEIKGFPCKKENLVIERLVLLLLLLLLFSSYYMG